MTWGIDLWDQIDKISNHTQVGIDFLERFSSFVRDRALIESDYAKALNNLIRKYQPKRKDDEDINFSYVKAFLNGLQEIQAIAQQHELLADTYRDKIAIEINDNVKNLKDERRMNLDYVLQLQQNAKLSVDEMNRSKKQYSDAYRAAEAAHVRYLKIENDGNYTRGEVDQRKNNFLQKSEMAEQAKYAYAAQLQKTNEQQVRHYKVTLRSAIDKIKEMDQQRIQTFKRCFNKSIIEEGNFLSATVNRLMAMQKHCDYINPDLDTEVVANRYKTGQSPQLDYAFTDMNAENGQNTLQTSFHNVNDLTPELKYNRTEEKLVEIERQIKLKTDQKNAVIKMQGVYRNNPNLGNPNNLDAELKRFENELQRLYEEKKNFEDNLHGNRKRSSNTSSSNYSSELSAPSTPNVKSYTGNRNSYTLRHNNSKDDGILSAVPKVDELDMIRSKAKTWSKTIGTAFGKRSSSTSSKSKLNLESRESTFDLDFDDDTGLGNCKALYDYKGTGEDSMQMRAGEEYVVLEQDTGDGWTKVGTKSGNLEGFVPTSYLLL